MPCLGIQSFVNGTILNGQPTVCQTNVKSPGMGEERAMFLMNLHMVEEKEVSGKKHS